MSGRRNEYLDAGYSDSGGEEGYDSEAAEYSKIRVKRRKLSSPALGDHREAPVLNNEEEDGSPSVSCPPAVEEKRTLSEAPQLPTEVLGKLTKPSKTAVPGVVYLSSLPPYLKPSALRNLLTQRGFSPITRLFLAPASKARNHHSSRKSSRQLYTEGWIEFATKKMAKRCAETLNATTVGGRKGGFYHDDIWNMKYLRGVGWDDLMAQVREERREEEARRMEERGQIARETKEFIEGVDRGKVARGIAKSREQKRKKHSPGVGEEVGENALESPGGGRTWRQYRVKGADSDPKKDDGPAVSEDVKRVLSKIF